MRSSLELLKHSNSINEFSRDLFPSKEWVFLLNNDFLLPLLGDRTFWFPPEQGTGRSKLDWGPGLERSLLLMQWNPYRSHALFLNESMAIGKEMWQPNFGWLLTRQSSNSFRSSRNNRKEAKRLSSEKREREERYPPPEGQRVPDYPYFVPLVGTLYVKTKSSAEGPR